MNGAKTNYDPKVKNNHKDTVFRMLFSEKKELLSLYNALNKTAYTNEEDLTVTTLENAVYLSMKNDISYIFQFRLYLYEHQSTVNPNIPLRDLFYLADLLKRLTAEGNLYGKKRIRIPEPRFMVFYNGVDEQPDLIEYRLSELYSKESEDPDLELRVQVLNINAGHNAELMAACRTLNEYAQFVRKIRENRATMSIEDAVKKAVDVCIREGILRDFLLKNKAEATNMSIYEYDAEQHARFLREEGREEERQNTEREKKRADAAEAEIVRLKELLLENKGTDKKSSIYEYDAEQHARFLREEGREEERQNTEREKMRADAAESRADAAESRADREKKRADAAEAELARLRELLAGKNEE